MLSPGMISQDCDGVSVVGAGSLTADNHALRVEREGRGPDGPDR